jgi:hypothetical protein
VKVVDPSGAMLPARAPRRSPDLSALPLTVRPTAVPPRSRGRNTRQLLSTHAVPLLSPTLCVQLWLTQATTVVFLE